MGNRNAHVGLPWLGCTGLLLFLMLALPAKAATPGFVGGIPPIDIGTFSLGMGLYKAPGDAISDSGFYALTRYELARIQVEIDYGFDKPNFFMGTLDYLWYVPTAEGITQTALAFGLGLTAANNDPTLDDSQFGLNALAKVRFAKTVEGQIRYDYMGDDSKLLTLGVSWAFF